MNPLTNMKNVKKLSEQELSGGSKTSWHNQYRQSAWIFIGGLPYDLTEGDIICIFSQYGEIVNINLVRDKDTGKSKGFCFICYEDQRSTDLAVDNFNGIKILNRIIRVDHVEDYKIPKDGKKTDETTKKLYEEGCAPKAQLVMPVVKKEPDEYVRETLADQIESEIRLPARLPIYAIKQEKDDEEVTIKKERKIKKKKQKKKKKKSKKCVSSDISENSSGDSHSDDEDSLPEKNEQNKSRKVRNRPSGELSSDDINSDNRIAKEKGIYSFKSSHGQKHDHTSRHDFDRSHDKGATIKRKHTDYSSSDRNKYKRRSKSKSPVEHRQKHRRDRSRSPEQKIYNSKSRSRSASRERVKDKYHKYSDSSSSKRFSERYKTHSY